MLNIPAFTVGLVVAFYWARVMHLARKIKRWTGHSANVLSPDLIGRFTRIIWFPTTLLWIALPLAGPLFENRISCFRPIYVSVPAAWIALFAGLLAFAATLICWKKMGKSWRMGIDPAEETSLIISGPYAFVRHPIYSLSSLLMLSTVVAYPSPPMIFVGVVHLLLLQFEARREEAHMTKVHGTIYADYCTRVGRFLPRISG